MEAIILKIFVSAGLASVAALGAPIVDRFRNASAGAFALAAAIMPWLIVAMLYNRSNHIALLLGLSCLVSLFLFATFFYSAGDPGVRRTFAIILITMGICSALYFCAIVIYPFLITD